MASLPTLRVLLALTLQASLGSVSLLDLDGSALPVPVSLPTRPPTLAHGCWRSVGHHRQLQLLPSPFLFFMDSSALATCADTSLPVIFHWCAALQCCARGSLGLPPCTLRCAGVSPKSVSSDPRTPGTPPCGHELLRLLPESKISEDLPRPLALQFVLEVEVLLLPCLLSASSADASQEQPAAMEYHRASPTLAVPRPLITAFSVMHKTEAVRSWNPTYTP